MMRRGFVLGKFMPPHQGHIFMCESAINMVDELSVLVCSLDREPIKGQLRFDWMQKLLPNAKVLHLHRDIPQEPSEHPDFWTIWTKVIREFHPEKIDYVFGSEPYILELAKHLDADPILIDPDREIFETSGTKVRHNIKENWNFLPPIVRAHYAKRICILGPESSGKSMLSKKLAEYFQTNFMPEYGRTYDEYFKQSSAAIKIDSNRQWHSYELVRLARTHMAMRDVLMGQANQFLIEDTDVLQTKIWEQYLIGHNSDEMRALVQNHSLADHYLILSPAEAFMDDGGRYYPDDQIRSGFYDAAIKLMVEHKCSYSIIDEVDRSLREKKAIKEVENFMGYTS